MVATEQHATVGQRLFHAVGTVSSVEPPATTRVLARSRFPLDAGRIPPTRVMPRTGGVASRTCASAGYPACTSTAAGRSSTTACGARRRPSTMDASSTAMQNPAQAMPAMMPPITSVG